MTDVHLREPAAVTPLLDLSGLVRSLAGASSAAVRAAAAVIFLFVALPTACPAQRSVATPSGILTGIYREAVKGSTSDWLEPKRRSNYLSKSLLALWVKSDAKKTPEGEVGAIDFDITTDTNALELKDFNIDEQSEIKTAAVVAVRLHYREPYYRPGPPAIVTYDFIREDGRWRIDNIRTKDWSVRDMLTLWSKAP